MLDLPVVAAGIVATGFTPAAIAVAYLAVISPRLVWFDATQRRLPNVLVVPGIAAGLLSCAGEWAVSGCVPVVPLVGGVAYSGFLLLLNLVGGMGMGDVKLAAALGLASWNVAVAVLSPVATFFVGGVVSVVLLAAGRRGRRIAFGPFLLGGFWTAVVLMAVSRL